MRATATTTVGQGCAFPTLMRRIATGLALAAAVDSCTSGVPHLRPGSNVALPRPESSTVVDLLLGGCQQAPPPTSSRTPARDVAECVRKDSTGRTVPDSHPAEPTTP